MEATGWLILGLLALIAGAELVTRGGVRFAARLGIPPVVIGLTIVAVGTSAPELAVGIEAGLRGNGSLAVANIAGTNVVNLLLILGLSALLQPLAITMRTLRFDLPVMTLAALALVAMAWDGSLTRLEGVLMVTGALVYTGAVVLLARSESLLTKARIRARVQAPACVGHPPRIAGGRRRAAGRHRGDRGRVRLARRRRGGGRTHRRDFRCAHRTHHRGDRNLGAGTRHHDDRHAAQ